MMHRARSLFLKLGPGLLYAGAAIGVSHLVQSTRAGASYGFQLVWVIFLANILKYPVLELGPRFAAVTGKDLVDGYYDLGKSALVGFILLNLASMFIGIATIILVTGGLFQSVLHLPFHFTLWCLLIQVICCAILLFGRYEILNQVNKYVVLMLSLSTIVAFLLVFFSSDGQNYSVESNSFSFDNQADLYFLLAFMGWMPAPMEVSVWHSMWTIENSKTMGEKKLSLKDVLFDFKVGFWGTIFMALAFVGLGSILMYGNSESFSFAPVPFAGQLISLYTKSIGDWAYPIVGFATIGAMFSTVLTCMDAYPRVLEKSFRLLSSKPAAAEKNSFRNYFLWLILINMGAFGIICCFFNSMNSLVDFTTCLAFLSAPILAGLNILCCRKFSHIKGMQHSSFLKFLSFLGILYLVGFSAYYLSTLF